MYQVILLIKKIVTFYERHIKRIEGSVKRLTTASISVPKTSTGATDGLIIDN